MQSRRNFSEHQRFSRVEEQFMQLAGGCAMALAVALAGAGGAASAQGTEAACAPASPVCGPDRVLDEGEITQRLFRPGEATRIEMTGGTSGRKFVLLLRPGSKLDMSTPGGPDFGRDWKLEGGKLCLRAYRNVWNGQFNCGEIQVREGKTLWVETMGDGSRNVIDAVSFVRP
jgi:hypothetical protein